MIDGLIKELGGGFSFDETERTVYVDVAKVKAELASRGVYQPEGWILLQVWKLYASNPSVSSVRFMKVKGA